MNHLSPPHQMTNEDELVALFVKVGMDTKKALETARSERLAESYALVLRTNGLETGAEKSIGMLLYLMVSTLPKELSIQNEGIELSKKIVDGSIKREDQVKAAFEYLKVGGSISETERFNVACGVGVTVTEETIDNVISGMIKKLSVHGDDINMTRLMRDSRINPDLRWAEGRLVKAAIDHHLSLMPASTGCSKPVKTVGSLTGSDSNSSESIKVHKINGSVLDSSENIRSFTGLVAQLHRPGENPQIKKEIMDAHLAATGGKVITRFPPEPNGYLHIGHAKAMNLNFNYAKANGGECNLRFDDTNPEAEEIRYYDAIRDAVSWLGFKPDRETSASKYFHELYNIAIMLIKNGKAYVCHMTPEEINLSRGGVEGKGPKSESPWRSRSVDENLKEFERMKNGEYQEGKAILRLKQDINSGNPCMWDLVAYRVLYTPHCVTGKEWCIYPMYDFTHCLCDSLENITHSLCTTEFIGAREAYYWVCDAAEVYKPIQWEYARLNITNTILSKRKLTKLVDDGIIKGWDDPRVYTLAGVRRRGFTPASINAFVEDLGVTTAYSVVDVKRLLKFVRDDLNKATMRRMAVLDPIEVVVSNCNLGGKIEMISFPNDPRDDSKGESFVPYTGRLYIDRSDFRADSLCSGDGGQIDPEEFFRLTPSQPVGLYRLGVFKLGRYECDVEGRVTKIEGTLDRSTDFKPKTFITWIPHCDSSEKGLSSPVKAEVRLYSELFKSRNPDSVPGGFLNDVNKESLKIITDAFVDPRLVNLRVEECFQFQRVGYFCVDPDSTDEKPVFNLTVSIKEDPRKI